MGGLGFGMKVILSWGEYQEVARRDWTQIVEGITPG
jgi:hypothetical protein